MTFTEALSAAVIAVIVIVGMVASFRLGCRIGRMREAVKWNREALDEFRRRHGLH